MKTIILTALIIVSLAAVAESWYYYSPYSSFSYYPSYSPYLFGKRELRDKRFYYPYYGSYYGLGGYYPYYFGKRSNMAQDDYDRNAVHCRVFRNDSMINCHSQEKLVECPVSLNMTVFERMMPESVKWEFFGLSRVASINYDEMPAEKHRFYMYPKCSATNMWLNNTQCLNNECSNWERVQIYYANNTSCGQGIRVIDSECFADLSHMFRSIVNKLVVPINGSMSVTRDLFGDILLV